jgi:ribosomal protein S12 methylthiotransferase accessory factor
MEMQIVFPGGQRVDALMGNLRIETNQDGTAPAPFSLFLASMGTCAGIYVLNFCQQRNLPTEGLRIIQRTRTNPSTRMVDRVDLEIQLPADFPEKYKDAVIKSAELCAVKKHLEAPPSFAITTTSAQAVP